MNITRLEPIYKDYIWGGKKLNKFYGKNSGMEKTAESWELACHKDGMCKIVDGEFSGQTLDFALKSCPDALGKKAEKFQFFPILIKLIDASDDLSVQVHPSDDYALKNEGEFGKTEMWYVVEAEENAKLVYGLKNKLSKEDFINLSKSEALMEELNFVPVKKGDVFFIEAGLIHAIGKGLLICEIQQNSNLTYRVYDYKRRDANGNERPLHVEKAAKVANLFPSLQATERKIIINSDKLTIENLASCEYFAVDKITLNGETKITPKDSFIALTIVDGEGTIGGLDVSKGTTVFVPANVSSSDLRGKMTILSSYIQ